MRIAMQFESESCEDRLVFSKIVVCHGLIEPSNPNSPAEARYGRADLGMTPLEARIARAIGRSNAVDVRDRSAGARFTVIAFPGQRCPHDIKAERILAEDAFAACILKPEILNRMPRSNLNSTRTKEGEPGKPANPKVDTIMCVGS